MSQTTESKISKRILWIIVIVLALIAVVSAGLFAYTSMNPQTVTLVSTSFATQTSFITSYETSTSYSTVTSLTTMTTAIGMGYPYGQGCYNSNYCQSPCYTCGYNSDINSNPCLITTNTNAAQCSGFLFISGTGCVELVIPIYALIGGAVYQYYTLHNLPQSYPTVGSWVTVTGQLHQGLNTAPNPIGLACPGNYINVTSITQ